MPVSAVRAARKGLEGAVGHDGWPRGITAYFLPRDRRLNTYEVIRGFFMAATTRPDLSACSRKIMT